MRRCWLWHYKCHSCQPNGVIGSSFRVQLGQALSLLSLSPPPGPSSSTPSHRHHRNLWPSGGQHTTQLVRAFGSPVSGLWGVPHFHLLAGPLFPIRSPESRTNIKKRKYIKLRLGSEPLWKQEMVGEMRNGSTHRTHRSERHNWSAPRALNDVAHCPPDQA